MSTVKTKRIAIASRFPAAPEVIWERLQKVETLQYIAAPYAYFRAAEPKAELIWREGAVFVFKLRIFGFIPLGTHTIEIEGFDPSTYRVDSSECNRFVPLWKHRITLKPEENGTTIYRDEVEIGAGLLTGLVALWSKSFYRHRQNKWRRLLVEG